MKVYIASPFFNDEEVSRVKKMESVLESRGYDVYSPMRDGIILTPDATSEDRLNTYRDNIDHVMSADVLVVIVATKDTGTSVELGVKVGQWEQEKKHITDIFSSDPDIVSEREKTIMSQNTPRIITFADNDKSVNVMLLGAVLRHCGSWDELNNYLDYIDRVGIDYAERDIKSITDVKVY